MGQLGSAENEVGELGDEGLLQTSKSVQSECARCWWLVASVSCVLAVVEGGEVAVVEFLCTCNSISIPGYMVFTDIVCPTHYHIVVV